MSCSVFPEGGGEGDSDDCEDVEYAKERSELLLDKSLRVEAMDGGGEACFLADWEREKTDCPCFRDQFDTNGDQGRWDTAGRIDAIGAIADDLDRGNILEWVDSKDMNNAVSSRFKRSLLLLFLSMVWTDATIGDSGSVTSSCRRFWQNTLLGSTFCSA